MNCAVTAPFFTVPRAAKKGAVTASDYLNTDEVHGNGQPVAVVVAEALAAAQEAAALMQAEYGPLPSTVDFTAEEGNVKPQKEILSGARKLGVRDGIRNVILADIAAEVDVHKSALLR